MSTATLFEKTIAMSEAVWKRHANPLSVYTGFLTTPLLALAIWSRDWIGYWSLVPLAFAILWIWLNPRLFAAPRSTDNWASKAVFGERIMGRRKSTPIPRHHATASTTIAAISAAGAIPLAYGLVMLDPIMLGYGLFVLMLARAWLLDRLVWLFEDMMHTSAEYRDWLY